MQGFSTPPMVLIVTVSAFVMASVGCDKKQEKPQRPTPAPIVDRMKMETARKALHDDLEVASRALCRRKYAMGRSLPGDGSKELADLLADHRTLEACASRNQSATAFSRTAGAGRHRSSSKTEGHEGNEGQAPTSGQKATRPADQTISACTRMRRRLRRALAHQAVCSPFAMTARSGERPPQVRQAVRFVDVLLDDALRIAARSPNEALNRLLLLAAMTEDFQRGPVPWTAAVAITNIWPKLGEAFAKVLSRTRRPSSRLLQRLAGLRRSLPSIRSVLLGEHLRRLAAAGLLPGRVDLSGNDFPALKNKQASGLDARAAADHRDLALLLARHFYQRALAGCRGRSLAVCKAALHRTATDTSSDQRLDELHRTFLVRFQSFDRFRRLVITVASANKGRSQTEDQASASYWDKLVAWARPWNENTIALLARPGFFLAAVGYHAKVMSFVSKHPTRAFYSQVAPLVFSFSEPFSGKPIVAKPSGRTIEVTPPPQASDLKVSPYVIRLKR